MKIARTCIGALVAAGLIAAAEAPAEENPFVGRWALSLPDGRPGWLGVEQAGTVLSASLLWGSGSVVPVDVAQVGAALKLSRNAPRKDDGTRQVIIATRAGDDLHLVSLIVAASGREGVSEKLSGRRIPPLPPRPNLGQIKFDQPIPLLSGDLSTNWLPVDSKAPNGWALVDGILSNRVAKKGARFGNLRTKEAYEDFLLTAEVRTLAGSNSGIYLRGVYEIQVAETFGKPPNGHSMGALYTRVTPQVSAERPVGEWQTLKIILVSRHVTVWLNGTLIIDNQPALGCTGGALTSDELAPGPLMLQGDHSDIDFRNIVISPVAK